MKSERTTRRVTRRQILAAAAAAPLALSSAVELLAADDQRSFKLGACDWSIGQAGQVGAVRRAAEMGLDGVEVSFGRPDDGDDLRKPDVRRRYLDAAAEHQMEISSLAMGVLNRVPYSSDDSAQRWVAECVEVMPLLKQKVVLLAFFGAGDINGKPDLQAEVIRRLKRVVPKAEAAGVTLGIESWMNADDHLRILDAVDSPSVQVYYDVANMTKMGYDIHQEIRQIGSDRICQVHCKENGFLLGHGKVDFLKVRESLNAIDWNGWLIIEGAVPPGGDPFESYVKNQKYLRSVFPTE